MANSVHPDQTTPEKEWSDLCLHLSIKLISLNILSYSSLLNFYFDILSSPIFDDSYAIHCDFCVFQCSKIISAYRETTAIQTRVLVVQLAGLSVRPTDVTVHLAMQAGTVKLI